VTLCPFFSNTVLYCLEVKSLSTAIPNFVDASASVTAKIFIEHLGTVTGTSSTSSIDGGSVGLQVTASAQPGVQGGPGISSQKTKSGNIPQNFHFLGKVPVNTDINWNFIATITAENEATILDGSDAAVAHLTAQWVNLIPQGQRHTLDKVDPSFFSDSLFSFDSVTKNLEILHSLSTIQFPETEFGKLDDGTEVQPFDEDYSNLKPEVESIIDRGLFVESDALLNSILQYSGIKLDILNPGVNALFTDGKLEFLDPSDMTTILAEANLQNIEADFVGNEFSADISGFSLVNIDSNSSPLARAFLSSGGVGAIWFDPEIAIASNEFSQSATTDVSYPVDANTAPIPLCVIPEVGKNWVMTGICYLQEGEYNIGHLTVDGFLDLFPDAHLNTFSTLVKSGAAILVHDTAALRINPNPGFAELTIEKLTSGGESTFSFVFPQFTPIDITTMDSSGSKTLILPAGKYSLSEIVPEGWELSFSSCSNGQTPDKLDLKKDDVVTCTFDNQVSLPKATLKIEKAANGPPTEFFFGGDLGSFSILTDGASGMILFEDLNDGTYFVFEDEQIPPWFFEVASCDNATEDDPESGVTLQPGEFVTCTFSNFFFE